MRTLKWETPCDHGICPYKDNDGNVDCECWCSAGSDEDYDPASQDEVIYEMMEV